MEWHIHCHNDNMRNYPFSLNMDESTSNSNKKVLAILVSYLNLATKKVDVEHLDSIELKKVNSASLYKVVVDFFTKNQIPWENLVSSMTDSCNVMRGTKSGVEARIRMEKNINLLDVDGDSCHYIHNAAKVFANPFQKWLEGLSTDLFEDHRWARDQLMNLEEVCEFLGIPFTTPPRFVSHRWLSAYDVTVTTARMMEAYTVLYFAFLSKSEQPVYKEVIAEICKKLYQVSTKAQARITAIHAELKKKSMTEQGKARKVRIVEKILFHREKTDLLTSVCLGVLPILKEYVMVFQGKKTICHKLHDMQMKTFIAFLACFVKAEHLQNLTQLILQKLDLNETDKLLKKTTMFVGDVAKQIVVKKGKDSTVFKFLDVQTAYTTCGSYLQKKLPLNSRTLQALCAIDPVVKGHSVTGEHLTDLADFFKQLLPENHSVSQEILQYNVDSDLKCQSDTDVVGW